MVFMCFRAIWMRLSFPSLRERRALEETDFAAFRARFFGEFRQSRSLKRREDKVFALRGAVSRESHSESLAGPRDDRILFTLADWLLR
jgi:hypothetical protein